jgi:hypothetical protein
MSQPICVMIFTWRRLGSACLAAALAASPAAAQYYGVSCGCRAAAPTRRYVDTGQLLINEYHSRSEASAVVGRSSVPAQTNPYYSADEAQALYHPVVIPLDEFLRPGEPTALTRDELAHQRAAAQARAVPPRPPQSATPQATAAEADPFQDDTAATAGPAAATDAQPAPGVNSTEEPAEPAGEDAFAAEEMAEEIPAEEPAAAEPESMPEAEAPPDAEAPAAADSDDDPFNDL